MRPSDVPIGGELITRLDGDDLYVVQAPPRVWINKRVLRVVATGQYAPDISLRDDVLTIRAKNRTVVYRIRPSDIPAALGGDLICIGEWPD
jgi:hypothetical protein